MRLDAHEAFIIGLIETAPDVTLAEIGECLATKRDVQATPICGNESGVFVEDDLPVSRR